MSRAGLSPHQRLELDVANVRDSLNEAVHRILMAWNEGQGTVDTHSLLDGLTNLACAQAELSGVSRKLAELSDEQENENDDEQPSDVHATVFATDDDPIALARSMQQKRHGASP